MFKIAEKYFQNIANKNNSLIELNLELKELEAKFDKQRLYCVKLLDDCTKALEEEHNATTKSDKILAHYHWMDSYDEAVFQMQYLKQLSTIYSVLIREWCSAIC